MYCFRFIEWKRNDGFVSHSAADSVCFCFLSYVLVQPCILSVSRCRDAGVNTCSCLLCVADIALLAYTSKDSPFISNVQRKGQNFSSSALNYNICRSHLTLLSLLMLNGSHPMSVSHQHVCPLPLNLLAVFLGKGALLYIVSVGHLALPIFIHLCRLPLYSCSI